MDKTSYALGMNIAQNMLQSGIKDIAIDDFYAGLKAVYNGEKPEITSEEFGQLLQAFFTDLEAKEKERVAQVSEAFRKEGEEFLAENAKKEGVVVLPSGLQYKVIKEGTGKKPSATSQVKCHYEGTLISGHKFDSSYDRNEPATFGLNQVIAGWTEGVQLMSEGATYEFYIPYQLAYGETGAPGAIPPYSALVFKVELIEVL